MVETAMTVEAPKELRDVIAGAIQSRGFHD
jgi:hypothetical protein